MGKRGYTTPTVLKLELFILNSNGERCLQIRHRSLLQGFNLSGSSKPSNHYKNKFRTKTATIPVIPATAEPTVCKRYACDTLIPEN